MIRYPQVWAVSFVSCVAACAAQDSTSGILLDEPSSGMDSEAHTGTEATQTSTTQQNTQATSPLTSSGGSTTSVAIATTTPTTDTSTSTSNPQSQTDTNVPVSAATTEPTDGSSFETDSTEPPQTSSGSSSTSGQSSNSTLDQPTGVTSEATNSSDSSSSTDSGEVSVDCGISPVNPNATAEARNLLCYLYSIYGEYVLSGQQETSWNPNPADDVDWISSQTGKYPAILGGDYLYPDGTTNRAKEWWQQGGLTMIRYHMGAPPQTDTYENSKSSANIDNVLRAGTGENTSFNSKLDYVAGELQILEDANVPVIWAPFHEVQPNGWFWWSKGTGSQFIALWKYMYDYLTNQKGLNNLIWLMPFSGTPDGSYYPGKEWLDLAGPDTYDMGQPFAAMYSKAKGIIGPEVPIPLHETGVIPNPDAMFPSSAPWLLFNIWAGYEKDTAQNSVANIKATYAHERTITRDEVPNLK